MLIVIRPTCRTAVPNRLITKLPGGNQKKRLWKMIYVDEMRVCLRNKNWPYSQACHMVADSIDELHRFAGRLGLRRSWFQNKTLPHYDLTIGMRVKAVKLGAIEIDKKKFMEILRKYRERRSLTTIF